MKNSVFITGILCVAPVYGWLPSKQIVSSRMLYQLAKEADDDEVPASAEMNTDDPCWQNMLDDDCSMGSIYAANFVAGKWLKSMPCGEGIEDCDMPEQLTSPGTRAGAGVENVDVMGFLGLKRAKSVDEPEKN